MVDYRRLHPVPDGGELRVQPFFFHRGQRGPGYYRGVLWFSQAEHATLAAVSGTGQMVVARSLVVWKRRRSVLSSTIRRQGNRPRLDACCKYNTAVNSSSRSRVNNADDNNSPAGGEGRGSVGGKDAMKTTRQIKHKISVWLIAGVGGVWLALLSRWVHTELQLHITNP